MIEISSKTNDHFRRWAELSSARGIKKHHEFILMGDKLIAEFLENPHFKVKAEIVHEDLKSLTLTAPSLRGQKIPVFKLPKVLFNEIDVVGTHYNLLVLEPQEIVPLGPAKTSGLEVISPLGDPANLGALARSALAFGASKMILTEESCSPYHPKAIKASAGALLKLPLFKVGKFPDFVAENSDEIFALDMKGENVGQFKWPKNVRLAIGEEGPGFSGMKGLKRLSVPTQSVESLNATVAASIALFSYANSQK